MSEEPGWGEGPSRERPPAPSWGEAPSRQPSPKDQPQARDSDADAPEREPGEGRLIDDPLTCFALGIGVVGLFFAGVVVGIVAFIVSAEAGRQARVAGRPQRYALWGFGLAVVDIVLWYVLHGVLGDLGFAAG